DQYVCIEKKLRNQERLLLVCLPQFRDVTCIDDVAQDLAAPCPAISERPPDLPRRYEFGHRLATASKSNRVLTLIHPGNNNRGLSLEVCHRHGSGCHPLSLPTSFKMTPGRRTGRPAGRRCRTHCWRATRAVRTTARSGCPHTRADWRS